MRDPAAMFGALRAGVLGPTLSPGEVDGVNKLIAACRGWPLAHAAYAMATAYHETAHSMQPVKERGSDAYFHRMYDKAGARPHVARDLGNTQPGDGVKYCGRGYVQLTGRRNYTWAFSALDLDLVRRPELAERADIAALILREGMMTGVFTGKRLSDYLPAFGPADRHQFRQARRIINGLDDAELIAGYAMQFQAALQAGGWE